MQSWSLECPIASSMSYYASINLSRFLFHLLFHQVVSCCCSTCQPCSFLEEVLIALFLRQACILRGDRHSGVCCSCFQRLNHDQTVFCVLILLMIPFVKTQDAGLMLTIKFMSSDSLLVIQTSHESLPSSCWFRLWHFVGTQEAMRCGPWKRWCESINHIYTTYQYVIVGQIL